MFAARSYKDVWNDAYWVALEDGLAESQAVKIADGDMQDWCSEQYEHDDDQ